MKTIFLGFVIITVAFVMTVNRYGKIKELHSENSRLESQTKSIPKLKTEVLRLESVSVDTNKLEELRGETLELMQLRATVAQLRPLTEKSKTEIEENIIQSKSSFDRAQTNFDREAGWIVVYGNRELRSSFGHRLGDKIIKYIDQNESFPVSLESFRQDFLESINGKWPEKLMNNPSLPPEYAGRVDVKLEDFELLTPPSDFLTRKERYLAFRETSPRQLPDGKWERYYGILRYQQDPINNDYYALLVELEDGNFEQWEREFAEQNSGN